jgi:ornithine cyclodeaminase/alanine dehydrogenase-like protein (mu-crystallin family)
VTASPSFPAPLDDAQRAELERLNLRNRGRSLDPPDVQAVALVLDWEQASHTGDIARAAEDGSLAREQVAELGRVLLGEEAGRAGEDEITLFDSTGLAVQDLAVATAIYERWRADPSVEAFAEVTELELA